MFSDYDYDWSNSQVGSSISNLCAGDYEVTATDDIGCSTTTTVTINDSDFQIAVSSFADPCQAMSAGTGFVFVSGGVAPYNFLWDNGEDTQVAINLDNGMHQVCLLYTSPSPRDATLSRMPSSA